jgi:DNA-binding winged helix-turn-helix (wHTH) protein/TolB-like protein
MARLRFGAFDFDPATRELRREGSPVRLQAQPAQVLAALLAGAGHVVTRESLRQTVWGDGTFVDFDGSLNFCIAQIRTALGDSADSPLYIRTLPKRGYQFIAPVAEIPDPLPPAEPAKRSRTFALVSATLAVAILSGGYAWRLYRERSAAPLRIAIARFENQTGNPGLDRFADGLSDTLIAEFTSAGPDRFAVIGNAASLRQPPKLRDLVAIGAALETNYIVVGQVQQSGSRIRVLAHLIRLPDQAHLWVTRTEFDLADPLRQQSEIAKRTAVEFSARLPPQRSP